jgi:hypothetical protein
VIHVPVVNEDGAESSVVVHAQRVLSTPSREFAVPINDISPWIDAPNLTQSLRVWIPWEDNAALPEGRWVHAEQTLIDSTAAGDLVSQSALEIDLTVYEQTEVDLASTYTSPGYSSEDSSFYYVLLDSTIGPTERVWWGGSGPTVLSVPVLDESTGEAVRMSVDSWKLACDTRWDLNAGQSADWGCDHSVVMEMADAGNEHLEAGHTYRTSTSYPVIIEGRRWHEPDAMALIHTFAFDLSFTVPE